MRRSRSIGTGTDRAHHGWPVVFTTGYGEGRTVVRPLDSRNSSSSARLFDVLHVYVFSTAVLALKGGCIWPCKRVELIG